MQDAMDVGWLVCTVSLHTVTRRNNVQRIPAESLMNNYLNY